MHANAVAWAGLARWNGNALTGESGWLRRYLATRAPEHADACGGLTRMRLLAVATGAIGAVALTACSAMPIGSPRNIPQLDMTFTQSVPASDSVSREEAIDALRAKGVTIPRPPEVVQYGTATCDAEAACFISGETSRDVWLLKWEASAGREWGTYVVDAHTGDVLGGFGGP